MTQRWRVLAAFVTAAALPVALDAHRLDEYLQASRLSIGRDRIDLEVDLTPGIAIARGVIADIDTDADGRFSTAETDAYARAVVASLTLAADAHPLLLSLSGHEFPEPAAMLDGLGTIRLRALASMPRVSAGGHRVEYANAFRRDASVYLANVLVPTDRALTIRSQERDPLQQRLTVTVDVAKSNAGRTGGAAASLTVLWIVIGARRRAARKSAAQPPVV